ncbi:hypothetical protein AXK61_14600 [Tsukamurella pseudospumae]|uniref:HTH tetR-type domain-containing protein n=1 Tax=Tsukamurella pseudospumae TaxID=239498 RepID=A0A137ZR53_9ACTN|nr:hypothetical protein AXK61_14600 [Tsukamurella pseudospumae]
MHDRRTRILDAAVEVFGTVGYRSATVDAVCAAASLSKRYFYESFVDREMLLLACYERCAGEIHDAMVRAASGADESIDARLRAALVGYFGAIADDPRRARITLLEILGVGPAIDAAYSEQTDVFAASVEALAWTSFAQSSLSAATLRLLAAGIVGAVTTIARQWLLTDRAGDQRDLVESSFVLVSAVLERLPRS